MTRTLAIALLCSTVLFAREQEELVFVRDAPGKLAIAVARGKTAVHRLSAAEAARFNAGIERVGALLAARTFLQQLRGVEVAGSISADNEAGAPAEPVPGFGFIRYLPIVVLEKNGKPAPLRFSTWEIAAGINAPCSGLSRINMQSDPMVYIQPEPAGEVDGVKVFTVKDGSELVVFTRNGKLPWVPVTREEYAAIWTRIWTQQAAKMPQAGAAVLQKMAIDPLAAGLRAMSPDQRRMQARSGMETSGGHDPFGSPLVKADPGWFDPALPRSAIQVISLKFDYSGNLNFERPEATANTAALRVWETLHRSTWADFRSALAE